MGYLDSALRKKLVKCSYMECGTMELGCGHRKKDNGSTKRRDEETEQKKIGSF